jgi:hypothetical protein
MPNDNIDHTVMVTLFYKINAYDSDHAIDTVKEILSDITNDDKIYDTEYQAFHYLGGN